MYSCSLITEVGYCPSHYRNPSLDFFRMLEKNKSRTIMVVKDETAAVKI
jgi:hypothetical protein